MILNFPWRRNKEQHALAQKAQYLGLTSLRNHWEQLRAPNGAVPLSRNFDPRSIAPMLEQSFIGERIGQGLVRIRVGGQNLNRIMGLDMKGLPLSSMVSQQARQRLADAVTLAFDTPAIVEIELEAEQSFAQSALKAKMLLLPMRNENGYCDVILGAIALDGAVGRAPRRFNVTQVVSQAIEIDPELIKTSETSQRMSLYPPVAPIEVSTTSVFRHPTASSQSSREALKAEMQELLERRRMRINTSPFGTAPHHLAKSEVSDDVGDPTPVITRGHLRLIHSR